MSDMCGNCRYWLSDGSAQEGICRRYPPAALMVGVTQNPLVVAPGQERMSALINSAFPPMAKAGWCGEFKRTLDS